MKFEIVKNEKLNEEVFKGFKKAKRFIEVVGRPLTDVEIYTFYRISEELFDLSTLEGVIAYSFNDEDITITCPFYDNTGRFIVSPVAEYGELFLNSNFINIIKDVMQENITTDNYKEKAKELYLKYRENSISKLAYYDM